MAKFSALLLDIEGTITSISFVKFIAKSSSTIYSSIRLLAVYRARVILTNDTLFPYAYNAVESFVREHFEDELMTEIIADIRDVSERESKVDSNIRTVRCSKDDCIADVSHNVRHWICIDKKVTAMKKLQGLIWNEAYTKGEVRGHIYPDVLPVLQSLSVPVYIYSSGSVLAQKLLFGNSVVGDVMKHLSGYFDTNVGLKGESKSYEKICKEIGVNPSDVLFLTDVEAEARAARAAGVQVVLVVRDGNSPLSVEATQDFRVIHSLEEIC